MQILQHQDHHNLQHLKRKDQVLNLISLSHHQLNLLAAKWEAYREMKVKKWMDKLLNNKQINRKCK